MSTEARARIALSSTGVSQYLYRGRLAGCSAVYGIACRIHCDERPQTRLWIKPNSWDGAWHIMSTIFYSWQSDRPTGTFDTASRYQPPGCLAWLNREFISFESRFWSHAHAQSLTDTPDGNLLVGSRCRLSTVSNMRPPRKKLSFGSFESISARMV
jgi:hypothetical protein